MTRWRKHVVMLASGGLLAAIAVVAPSAVAGPAAFTSVDIGIDGAGHCVHGNPAVNCNAYDGKEFVWLNGGPLSAQLGNGDYFFAVVKSGGQSDPNDPQSTNDNLLSSDPYTDRTFTVSGCPGACVFTFTGADPPHTVDGSKVRLVPYVTTAHVYHLQICKLDENGLQPEKKDCKSDAFKVKEGDGGGGGGFSAPSADKTADGTHSRNVSWDITKSADQTVIHSGSPVETHYTVTADKTISNEKWGVEGTITVTNTNDAPLDVTDVVENLATDEPTLGAHCTVGPPTSGSVPAQSGNPPAPGTLDFDYSCSFDNEPDYTETYLNSATVSYTNPDTQATDTVDAVMTFTVPEDATLDEGSDPECVTVSDTNADPVGSPGTGTEVCDDTTFNYSITFFNNLCVDYPNEASLDTGDTADWTVTFCGPNAGGKTQGWWQNKNGQALLKANLTATHGPCETLTGYITGHTGAGDLINGDSTKYSNQLYNTAECATPTTAFSYLPSFDLKVFAVGTCSGNCWSMLLSQWLTTLLDTAAYPTTIKAGGPALTAGAKIYNPDLLLGLPVCTTIGNLLTQAVNQFPTYKNTKSTVSAVSGMFDRINNNVQPSCV